MKKQIRITLIGLLIFTGMNIKTSALAGQAQKPVKTFNDAGPVIAYIKSSNSFLIFHEILITRVFNTSSKK